MESNQKENKKLSSHYEKYRTCIRLSQKKYYDNNVDKLKEGARNYYKNNTEYRDRKIIKMREYRDRKRQERLNKDKDFPLGGVQGVTVSCR